MAFLPPLHISAHHLKQNMDKVGAGTDGCRKPRFLCIHGFRTSSAIMRKQLMEKWPECLTSRLDLIFADAPFPAEGKSEVEGIFDPPFYEWFQFNTVGTQYKNFDECLSYIEDLMIQHGPIDGFIGFSQGAFLSAALPGLQAKGLALKRVPPVVNLVIIGGGKLLAPAIAESAYREKIKCRSLHFIGQMDYLKVAGEDLLNAFVDPTVVRHPKGHTIPRLDEKSLVTVLSYIERIEKSLNGTELLSLTNSEELIEAAEY